MCCKEYGKIFETFVFCALVFLASVFILTNILPIKQKQKHLSNQTKAIKQTPSISEKFKKLLKCENRKLVFEKLQHGDYHVLKNFFIGRKTRKIKCSESITYTTTSDYTFLHSLPIVLKRWLAPMSVSLYTPGFDFNKTMESLQFLRNCLKESKLIKDFVSFHIYFPKQHMPTNIPMKMEQEASKWHYNCTGPPPYKNVNRSELYKTQANLTFPINVGRNIARKAANTYFVFACDIELIPSPKLVAGFFKMIASDKRILLGNEGKRVFALPVFEIRADATIPSNKIELKKMLATKKAFTFHDTICRDCHMVPNYTSWLNSSDDYAKKLSIVAVGKRQGSFKIWEPFFISNNKVPMFDERVTWEGQSNKRVQSFAMCLLDYEFHVLHPAFLTHMPGIKKFSWDRLKYVGAMNHYIQNHIEPEYRKMYGNNDACST